MGVVLSSSNHKDYAARLQSISDVITSSVPAEERAGHASGELAIYIKLKWFKSLSLLSLYTVTMVMLL